VITVLGYALCFAALILRVRTTDELPPEPARPRAGEPVWLTRVHHTVFAAILLGGPVERVVAGGDAAGRVLGLALFAAGVVLYRAGGSALGEALSPFIEPRTGAALVTRGPYRHLRHPIYLGEALIALGAPLTLGCRAVLVLTALALLVLVLRIAREEEALARTFPDYARYAASTKRLVPFVY
jgi:protein-S-isoprenylcysteine O-methyltransferase Ste14